MKKNKYFLFNLLAITKSRVAGYFLAFLLVFLFLSTSPALALEVQYPRIPLLPTITQNSDIKAYAAYFFGLFVILAGILALISFVIGAVGLINPNIEAHKDAKDRMKGAILGLVLASAAFIIIKTINPGLINTTITVSPPGPGVFYYNGSIRGAIGDSVSDTSTRPAGFDSLLYDCGSSGTGPALLIWGFANPGLDGGNNLNTDVTMVRLTCSSQPVTTLINGFRSFKWIFENPGVYFCLGGCSGNMCSGYMSYSFITNAESILPPFKGNIKGVRIVGDNYGIILHSAALEGAGICSNPIASSSTVGANDSSCQTSDIKGVSISSNASVSAADIFLINQEPEMAGNGVNFYSEPRGWDTGQNAGYWPTDNRPDYPETISSDITQDLFNAGDMCFDYDGVDRTDPYMYRCTNSRCWGTSSIGNIPGVNCSDTSPHETFQDSPGSMQFNRNYLVAIYAGQSCQTFTSQTFTTGVPDFGAQPIGKPPMSSINNIYIIPTQ